VCDTVTVNNLFENWSIFGISVVYFLGEIALATCFSYRGLSVCLSVMSSVVFFIRALCLNRSTDLDAISQDTLVGSNDTLC